MASNDISVKLKADSTQLDKALDATRQKLDATGQAAEKAAEKLQKPYKAAQKDIDGLSSAVKQAGSTIKSAGAEGESAFAGMKGEAGDLKALLTGDLSAGAKIFGQNMAMAAGQLAILIEGARSIQKIFQWLGEQRRLDILDSLNIPADLKAVDTAQKARQARRDPLASALDMLKGYNVKLAGGATLSKTEQVQAQKAAGGLNEYLQRNGLDGNVSVGEKAIQGLDEAMKALQADGHKTAAEIQAVDAQLKTVASWLDDIAAKQRRLAEIEAMPKRTMRFQGVEMDMTPGGQALEEEAARLREQIKAAMAADASGKSPFANIQAQKADLQQRRAVLAARQSVDVGQADLYAAQLEDAQALKAKADSDAEAAELARLQADEAKRLADLAAEEKARQEKATKEKAEAEAAEVAARKKAAMDEEARERALAQQAREEEAARQKRIAEIRASYGFDIDYSGLTRGEKKARAKTTALDSSIAQKQAREQAGRKVVYTKRERDRIATAQAAMADPMAGLKQSAVTSIDHLARAIDKGGVYLIQGGEK